MVVKKHSNRPSWDVYFANIVEDVAMRSTCIRHKFGTVIVNERREIISTGYNGPVRGAPHCDVVGCVKNDNNIESGMGHGICPAVHSEANALLQAGKQARGATLYVNGFPCKICARLMVNAGIRRVVISGEYTDKEGLEILDAADIEVAYVDSEEGGEASKEAQYREPEAVPE
jgi:dCMP deaminase